MPTISHKSILKQFSRKLKLALKTLFYTLEEILLGYVEAYSDQNSIFVDADQKCYTEF